MLSCAATEGTDFVYYEATLSSLSSFGEDSFLATFETITDFSTTDITSTESFDLNSISSGSSSSFHTTTSSSASPSTTTHSAANSRGSSTPVGAIIGGTIGGVAVVALFVLGLVFLLRRRQRNPGSDEHSNAKQAPIEQPGGYPPELPPSQPLEGSTTGRASVVPDVDNRSSIQKPGYSVYNPSMASPLSSPPLHSQGPGLR